MGRRIVLVFALVFAALIGAAEANAAVRRIDAYVRAGCAHCERAKEFLTVLKAEDPGLQIVYHDVAADKVEAERFEKLMRDYKVERPAVPAFLIGGRLLIGFGSADTTGNVIRDFLSGEGAAFAERREFSLPFIGRVSVETYGLALFTVAVGLIDGFNPCAMWVLLFLLSMLVNVGDRRKMAAIAGVFVLVSGAVYFAFMAAWLNFFFIAGAIRTIQVVLALIALVAAAVNVKDFFAFGRGPTLGVSAPLRARIGGRIRGVVSAENLVAALAGVVVLAVAVNFIELICTAGLPALYTGVLAAHPMSALEYYGYLALYNAAYIFDDSVMVFTAVYGLTRRRVREGAGRALKLISGLVMAALGLLLLLKPEWLSFFR